MAGVLAVERPAVPFTTEVADRPRRVPGRRAHLLGHGAVQFPLVLAVVVELLRGWRPTSDDANIAFRSWMVFSAHTPLVGQFTQASLADHRSIFDTGPLLYWGLALPVHLDPGQGMLWGAALMVGAAFALSVEAARSIAGMRTVVPVVGVILVTVVADPGVVTDPGWNPHMGLSWFIATLALSWAVGSGRLSWLPVLVAAASMAGQCHLIFLVPSLTCVVSALVLAVWTRGCAWRRWRRPLCLSAGVGALCWTAPLVQQLTTHPGNMTLLAGTASTGPHLGTGMGWTTMASGILPWPTWILHPDAANVFSVFGALRAHGIAVSVSSVLGAGAVAVLAWRRRERSVTCAAVLLLVAGASFAFTVASMSVSGTLSLTYLYPSVWPVGIGIVMVYAWALWVGIADGVRRSGRNRDPDPSAAAGSWPGAASHGANRPAGRLLVVGLCVCGAVAAWSTGRALTTASPTLGGWGTIENVTGVSRFIEAHTSRQPVLVTTRGQGTIGEYELIYGVAWRLFADGRTPRLEPDQGAYVGQVVVERKGSPGTVAYLTYVPGATLVEVDRPGAPRATATFPAP